MGVKRIAALLGLLLGMIFLAVPAQASTTAGSALSWAEHHAAGASYAWGMAGPWSYDCSGLVMTAYRHEGVILPHNTVAMIDSGELVPTSDPQPGDLAFWGPYDAPYHVELYVRPGVTFGARTYGESVGYHSNEWFAPSSYWRIR